MSRVSSLYPFSISFFVVSSAYALILYSCLLLCFPDLTAGHLGLSQCFLHRILLGMFGRPRNCGTATLKLGLLAGRDRVNRCCSSQRRIALGIGNGFRSETWVIWKSSMVKPVGGFDVSSLIGFLLTFLLGPRLGAPSWGIS